MNFFTENYLKLNKNLDNKYILKSIVIHKGTKDNGHYYLYTKDINKKWYIYDDKQVNLVDKSDVLKIAYGCKDINSENYNANAYLIIYEKNNKDNCDLFDGIINDFLNKDNIDKLSNDISFNNEKFSDTDYDSENMSLEKEENLKDEILNNNFEEFLDTFQNMNLENKINNKISLLNQNLKPIKRKIDIDDDSLNAEKLIKPVKKKYKYPKK